MDPDNDLPLDWILAALHRSKLDLWKSELLRLNPGKEFSDEKVFISYLQACGIIAAERTPQKLAEEAEERIEFNSDGWNREIEKNRILTAKNKELIRVLTKIRNRIDATLEQMEDSNLKW